MAGTFDHLLGDNTKKGTFDNLLDSTKSPSTQPSQSPSLPPLGEAVVRGQTQTSASGRTGRVDTVTGPPMAIEKPSILPSPVDGAQSFNQPSQYPSTQPLDTATADGDGYLDRSLDYLKRSGDYVARSWDYAKGLPDYNPTLLGEMWRGGGEGIVNNPASLLAAGLVAANPALGVAELAQAGLSRYAPAIIQKAAPFIAGMVEGAGLSVADQITGPLSRKYTYEGTEDSPNVSLVPTVIAGLTGGLLRGGSSYMGGKVKDYRATKKAEAEFEADPTKAVFNSPKTMDAAKQHLENQKNIDPNGLYNKYLQKKAIGEEAGDVNWHNGLLADAKQDIALRSAIPVKSSSISNSEARNHLTNIVKQMDEELNNFDPMSLYQNAKPKPYEYSLNKLVSGIPSGIGTGYVGHALFGVPGAIVGGLLGYEPGRKLVEAGITKSVPIASAISKPSTNVIRRFVQTATPGKITNDAYIHQDPMAPPDSTFFHF